MKLYAMKDLLQGESSRYKLVNVVAHRAREIAVDAEKDQVSLTEKPVTMALEEATEGLLFRDEDEQEAE
jgi:DNA-directed RNA polymerase subunit omega